MVQHYFANGLLPDPVRPKANVAEYGEEHVRAIEVIRRLQTEERLTINEIKKALSGAPTGPGPEVAALPHLDTLFAIRTGLDTQLVPLGSLEARNPRAVSDAEILQGIGAIRIETETGQPMLSRMDAQIVGLWGDLRASGFTEERGFDANIVSMYLKAARELASAEIDLFVAHVDPAQPVEERAAMAEAGSRIMLSVFTVLRMKAEFEAFQQAERRSPDPALAADPRRVLRNAVAGV
jgi:DNA-binding transcriptional MerR regulator